MLSHIRIAHLLATLAYHLDAVDHLANGPTEVTIRCFLAAVGTLLLAAIIPVFCTQPADEHVTPGTGALLRISNQALANLADKLLHFLFTGTRLGLIIKSSQIFSVK